ncbi:hypothetical protein BBJ28_00022920 [Nothophytophthora sp. Chile5]|nr:hypothetical protein BBJ28_00022920 [Nothophytophthora sp. Chile5]
MLPNPLARACGFDHDKQNPRGYRFPDSGRIDPCDCERDCFRNTCLNAGCDVYCTKTNCSIRGRCSNSVYECKGIELMITEFGLGVRATSCISVGSVMGEYLGTLTTHDYEKDEETTNEYAMKLQTRSVTKEVVYIDAAECGGMIRFINHSCEAKCVFVEMRNRRQVKVLVLVKNPIMIGEEVTVGYGDDLWVSCTCGQRSCCSLVALDQGSVQ